MLTRFVVLLVVLSHLCAIDGFTPSLLQRKVFGSVSRNLQCRTKRDPSALWSAEDNSSKSEKKLVEATVLDSQSAKSQSSSHAQSTPNASKVDSSSDDNSSSGSEKASTETGNIEQIKELRDGWKGLKATIEEELKEIDVKESIDLLKEVDLQKTISNNFNSALKRSEVESSSSSSSSASKTAPATTPATSRQYVAPVKPAEPVQSVQSPNPAKPAQSSKPVESSVFVRPTQPSVSSQPVQPLEPNQPKMNALSPQPAQSVPKVGTPQSSSNDDEPSRREAKVVSPISKAGKSGKASTDPIGSADSVGTKQKQTLTKDAGLIASNTNSEPLMVKFAEKSTAPAPKPALAPAPKPAPAPAPKPAPAPAPKPAPAPALKPAPAPAPKPAAVLPVETRQPPTAAAAADSGTSSFRPTSAADKTSAAAPTLESIFGFLKSDPAVDAVARAKQQQQQQQKQQQGSVATTTKTGVKSPVVSSDSSKSSSPSTSTGPVSSITTASKPYVRPGDRNDDDNDNVGVAIAGKKKTSASTVTAPVVPPSPVRAMPPTASPAPTAPISRPAFSRTSPPPPAKPTAPATPSTRVTQTASPRNTVQDPSATSGGAAAGKDFPRPDSASTTKPLTTAATTTTTASTAAGKTGEEGEKNKKKKENDIPAVLAPLTGLVGFMKRAQDLGVKSSPSSNFFPPPSSQLTQESADDVFIEDPVLRRDLAKAIADAAAAATSGDDSGDFSKKQVVGASTEDVLQAQEAVARSFIALGMDRRNAASSPPPKSTPSSSSSSSSSSAAAAPSDATKGSKPAKKEASNDSTLFPRFTFGSPRSAAQPPVVRNEQQSKSAINLPKAAALPSMPRADRSTTTTDSKGTALSQTQPVTSKASALEGLFGFLKSDPAVNAAAQARGEGANKDKKSSLGSVRTTANDTPRAKPVNAVAQVRVEAPITPTDPIGNLLGFLKSSPPVNGRNSLQQQQQPKKQKQEQQQTSNPPVVTPTGSKPPPVKVGRTIKSSTSTTGPSPAGASPRAAPAVQSASTPRAKLQTSSTSSAAATSGSPGAVVPAAGKQKKRDSNPVGGLFGFLKSAESKTAASRQPPAAPAAASVPAPTSAPDERMRASVRKPTTVPLKSSSIRVAASPGAPTDSKQKLPPAPTPAAAPAAASFSGGLFGLFSGGKNSSWNAQGKSTAAVKTEPAGTAVPLQASIKAPAKTKSSVVVNNKPANPVSDGATIARGVKVGRVIKAPKADGPVIKAPLKKRSAAAAPPTPAIPTARSSFPAASLSSGKKTETRSSGSTGSPGGLFGFLTAGSAPSSSQAQKPAVVKTAATISPTATKTSAEKGTVRGGSDGVLSPRIAPQRFNPTASRTSSASVAPNKPMPVDSKPKPAAQSGGGMFSFGARKAAAPVAKPKAAAATPSTPVASKPKPAAQSGGGMFSFGARKAAAPVANPTAATATPSTPVASKPKPDIASPAGPVAASKLNVKPLFPASVAKPTSPSPSTSSVTSANGSSKSASSRSTSSSSPVVKVGKPRPAIGSDGGGLFSFGIIPANTASATGPTQTRTTAAKTAKTADKCRSPPPASRAALGPVSKQNQKTSAAPNGMNQEFQGMVSRLLRGEVSKIKQFQRATDSFRSSPTGFAGLGKNKAADAYVAALTGLFSAEQLGAIVPPLIAELPEKELTRTLAVAFSKFQAEEEKRQVEAAIAAVTSAAAASTTAPNRDTKNVERGRSGGGRGRGGFPFLGGRNE